MGKHAIPLADASFMMLRMVVMGIPENGVLFIQHTLEIVLGRHEIIGECRDSFLGRVLCLLQLQLFTRPGTLIWHEADEIDTHHVNMHY
jgi:hypothetical protein